MIALVSTDDPGELVLVYATASIMEGYLVKGRLEAEGIHVLLKGGAEGPYRMGPAELYVTKEEEAEARELLESVTIEEPQEDDAPVESLNGDEPPR